MTDPVEQANPDPESLPSAPSESWMKVGAIAAFSALAGGLAAAWYYRKTLARLQDAESAAAPPPPANDDDV